ncbi:MAG: DUF116 domain-containing protein [Lentisphaeria bacterium]|nr:DUF116 domain-containing protein [Lentisphaeria bacterium]
MVLDRLHRLVIRVNNAATRWRRVRVRPDELLVLLPRCLQNEDCGRAVQKDVEECARCGVCPLRSILALRDRYGFRMKVAGGGREALAAVQAPGVRAVLAVACVPELYAGILAALPKPVLAVPHEQPCGPCRNTRVDLARVEAAIRSVLEHDNRREGA